jgi:micrococcal nuclease
MRMLAIVAVVGGLAGFAAADWTRAPSSAGAAPAASPAVAAAADRLSARFGFCHSGGGANCVVDGDTFWMGGEKIRIADIDTPETHPPRCTREAELGAAATRRLHALLNAGPMTLAAADRDTDKHGRKLRIVTRGGRSLGDVLVAEGLARRWTGRRQPWC